MLMGLLFGGGKGCCFGCCWIEIGDRGVFKLDWDLFWSCGGRGRWYNGGGGGW